MIQLTIGTNTKRTNVIVEPQATLTEVLEDNQVDVMGCALHLNGTLIAGVDLEDSLEDLGVRDGTKAMLIAVKKADSAS